MGYQIVKFVPDFDDRDCSTVIRVARLPNSYETLGCAHKVAARLSSEDEYSYQVIPYGGDAFKGWTSHAASFDPFADMPF